MVVQTSPASRRPAAALRLNAIDESPDGHTYRLVQDAAPGGNWLAIDLHTDRYDMLDRVVIQSARHGTAEWDRRRGVVLRRMWDGEDALTLAAAAAAATGLPHLAAAIDLFVRNPHARVRLVAADLGMVRA